MESERVENLLLDRFNPTLLIGGFDHTTGQVRESIKLIFAAADERANSLCRHQSDLAAREALLAADRAALEGDRRKHEELSKSTKGLSALASQRLGEIRELQKTQAAHLKEIDRLKEENRNLRGAILALNGQEVPVEQPVKKVKQPVAAPVS